ncbi:hypothetical protein CBR_g1074 [Chara braunii]|uniref:BED-type domain-containing protein n=1 Tax=Chara braunii TaxID=69332 RepID=A0A388KD26_CHABU|nr:hypothetical protein CBR_g1074 [Chara braunii]|eukprot:GBG67955.1 hypothetical protein CBR_g1074 [Chara braunii]
MGKKKKKAFKPWCYYCEREFDDEKILIQHQKAKHFKCHVCHKKLSTAGGMVVHVLQVHKENVVKVPNSKPGRESTEIEIFGMEGIPPDVMEKHTGEVAEDDKQPPAKTAKIEIPMSASTLSAALPAAPGMTSQSMFAAVPPVLMAPQPPTLQPPTLPIPVRPGWPSTTSAGWSTTTNSGQGWPSLRPTPGQPPILAPPPQPLRLPPPQPLFPIQGVRQPGSSPQQPLFPINGPSSAGTQSAHSSIRPVNPIHPPIAPIPRPPSTDSSTSSASLLTSSSGGMSMGQVRLSGPPPVVLPPPNMQPRLYSFPPPGISITPPSTDAMSDAAALGSTMAPPPPPPGVGPSLSSGMAGPFPPGVNPLAPPGGLNQVVPSACGPMMQRGVSVGPRSMMPPMVPPPSVPPPSLLSASMLPPSVPPPTIPPLSMNPPSIPPPSAAPSQLSLASLPPRAMPPVAPPLGPPPLGLPVVPPSGPLPPPSSPSQSHHQLQAQPPVPPPPPYQAASRPQPYELPSTASSVYAAGPTTSGGASIGPPVSIPRPPLPPPTCSEVYLVWDDEQMSMEERRALLPRYMVDDMLQVHTSKVPISLASRGMADSYLTR